jgi:hypothetical protein
MLNGRPFTPRVLPEQEQQPQRALDAVVDVAEAAHGVAAVDEAQGPARLHGADELADHPPTTGLIEPGAVGVEVAHAGGGEALLDEGPGEVLARDLARGVAPARVGGGTEPARRLGAERQRVLAIGLRRAGEQHGRAHLAGGEEDGAGAEHVDVEHLERPRHVVVHARHGRHVEDTVAAGDEPPHQRLVAYVAGVALQRGVVGQAAELPADVEGDDLMPAGEQRGGERAAEEATGAGDEHTLSVHPRWTGVEGRGRDSAVMRGHRGSGGSLSRAVCRWSVRWA